MCNMYLANKLRRDNHVISLTSPVFSRIPYFHSQLRKSPPVLPIPPTPSGAWDGVWEEGFHLHLVAFYLHLMLMPEMLHFKI